MIYKHLVYLVILPFIIFLTGCDYFNIPTFDATSVYQTVIASMTIIYQEHGTVLVETPEPTSSLSTLEASPNRTIQETPGSKNPVCDRAAAGHPLDITIPDNMVLHPGQAFSKTWSLENIGSCTWTEDYAVVWFSGEQMGFSGQRMQHIEKSVVPGQSIKLTLDLIAPTEPGVHQGNWKLRNPEGDLFGIGPDGNSSFWARILIADEKTQTPSPVPTVTPTSDIYSHGEVLLLYENGLDLDSGKVNKRNYDDIVFNLSSNGALSLTPMNGARIAIYGNRLPTQHECEIISLGTDPLAIPIYQHLTYICYKTNLGLPGVAGFIKSRVLSNAVDVDFITWSAP